MRRRRRVDERLEQNDPCSAGDGDYKHVGDVDGDGDGDGQSPSRRQDVGDGAFFLHEIQPNDSIVALAVKYDVSVNAYVMVTITNHYGDGDGDGDGVIIL